MRHRTRHTHETVVQHLTAKLTELGWVSAPINFGATPVTIQTVEPFGEGAVQPDGNLVSITLGDSTEDEDEELGGAMIAGFYALFVDVVGESIPLSVALADDIRLALKNHTIPLKDFTSNPAGVEVAGGFIEFEAVELETPPAASSVDKRTWRVVTATLNVRTADDSIA